jgi:hypothetical protein
LIHTLPLVGVLGARRLSLLYGIAVAEPNLELLLRHRAVNLGLVGALLFAGAASTRLLPAALAVGAVSAGSYALLAVGNASLNPALQRVLRADVVALVAMAAAAVVEYW